jgi:hypothetical protein
MDFEELDLHPIIESPHSAAASRDRAKRWANLTARLQEACNDLCVVENEITRVCSSDTPDLDLLDDLEFTRNQAEQIALERWADRELLKPEYWGK